MESSATQTVLLEPRQISPITTVSAKPVPMRSAALSQSSQSFRAWLALAQQRTMLGLSGWGDSQGSSLSSFGSQSLPLSALGLQGSGLSTLGLQSSSLSTLGISSGLGEAACPLCGASTSSQALLSAAMMQIAEAVAREAATEVLRETMMFGIPLAGSGSVNPLDAMNGLRVIPATPSATETPAIGTTGVTTGMVANPASAPAMATGIGATGPANPFSGLTHTQWLSG